MGLKGRHLLVFLPHPSFPFWKANCSMWDLHEQGKTFPGLFWDLLGLPQPWQSSIIAKLIALFSLLNILAWYLPQEVVWGPCPSLLERVSNAIWVQFLCIPPSSRIPPPHLLTPTPPWQSQDKRRPSRKGGALDSNRAEFWTAALPPITSQVWTSLGLSFLICGNECNFHKV